MDSRLAKEKQIVLAQLMATSPTIRLSIGGASGMKTYSTDEIIEHVSEMDEFGKKFVETQMDFMRSFKNGDIYTMLAEIDG